MSAPIRFLSVCSGIEAASVEHGASKPCSHCKQIKSLDDFHKSAKGKLKRASWCKPCMNAITREGRKRTYSSENKRKWQIKTRYGITCEQVDAILSGQSAASARRHADKRNEMEPSARLRAGGSRRTVGLRANHHPVHIPRDGDRSGAASL